MGTLILFVIILAIIYAIYVAHRSGSPQPARQNKLPRHIQNAVDALQSALDRCVQEHPDAIGALLWLAASDGVVSKQELRILLRFGETAGARIGHDAHTAVDLIGSGLSVSEYKTPDDPTGLIEALKDKPAGYRLAFLGAAHQLCGNSKRLSKNKRDFLARAEQLFGVG